MRLRKSTLSKSRIIWIVVNTLVLGFGAYALANLFISGVLPAKYVVIASGVFVGVAALAPFLSLHSFQTKKRHIVARVLAGIILGAVLIGAATGLYVLNRSLSVLDKVSNNKNAVTIETRQAFNIFISGIDTYGDINNQSRSDVNIVATVNPNAHKIFLTTIPRDSYVSIALGGNDQMDKLTHAGNYGVESSMKTVARLLDTDIDAYIRINFSSFIKSIDTLGDITIDNPVAFSINGVSFPKGELTLNGEKALLYSRERKDLAAGDIDRGKNQQRVIQGIINKITEIRTPSGFDAILNLFGSSIQTNLSSGTIKALINRQIDNPTNWTTESYIITGKGQTGGLPSYAMPKSQLYMYVLDSASVKSASQNIQANLK